ncbi:MAG: ubiquinol-cytochrome C chaperone family protein [Methyloligellaceae bacterium]
MPIQTISSIYYNIIGGTKKEKEAGKVYETIVAHARSTEFYKSYAIPDSWEGRFEIITLHMFLFLQRLKAEDDSEAEIGKLVLEAFFSDLDGSLRERGVGDTVVPKKMQKLAKSFYQRVYTYSESLENKDQAHLASEIQQHVYDYLLENEDENKRYACASALSAYLHKAYREICNNPLEQFMLGQIKFIQPEIVS